MAPKWRPEETALLLRMVDEQVELEKQDVSNVMSWASLFKICSARLQQHGYERTHSACYMFYIRTPLEGDEGEAHRDTATPDLGDNGPTAAMSPSESSQPVPLPLQESGWNKTPVDSSAYWGQFETSAEITSELNEGNPDDDEQTPEIDGMIANDEDHLPPDLVATSWSPEEFENLFRLVKERCETDKTGVSEFQFWNGIADWHRECGFDRTLEACETFWNKRGREWSGYDEQAKLATKSGLPNAESRASSSTPTDSSSSSTPVDYSPFVDCVAEAFEVGEVRPDEKRRESSHSSTLGRPANHSEKSSSVRKGSKDIGFIRKQNRKGLRFTATQRQVLTAEALATGGRASATRRTELAQDFEVAENTIENWFKEYKHNDRPRRSQQSIVPAAPSTSAFDGLDDDSHPTNPKAASQGITPRAATTTHASRAIARVNDPRTSSKRPCIEEKTPEYTPPSKKARLEPEDERSRPADGFNPVSGNSSHRYLAPQPKLPSNILNSGRKAKVSEARPDEIHVAPANPLPLSPVVPSNGPSSLEENNSTTMKERAEAQQSLRSPPPQPNLYPEATSYPTRVIDDNDSERPNIRNKAATRSKKSHLTNHMRANPSYGFDPLNTSTSSVPFGPSWPGSRAILDDGGGRMRSSPPSSARQPDRVTTPVATFAVDKQNDCLTAPAKTQASSPNREWSRQFHARHHSSKTTHSENPRPASTPLSPNTSLTPLTNVDSKGFAAGRVALFRSRIQSGKDTRATRTLRLSNFKKQHSTYTTKHAENEAAKQEEIARTVRYFKAIDSARLGQQEEYMRREGEAAGKEEIARAVGEIEERYAKDSARLRQQEEQIRREIDAEAEALNEITLKLAGDEEELEIWQRVVEFYSVERDREASSARGPFNCSPALY